MTNRRMNRTGWLVVSLLLIFSSAVAKATDEIIEEGNILRIETKYPKSDKFWGGESVNVSVDYKLWIPEKAALKANNISGDISAEAIGGAAALKDGAGDIQTR